MSEGSATAESDESVPLPPGSPTPSAGGELRLGSQKIEVQFQATGDTPIMKQKKWLVEGSKPISWIASVVRKYLKMDSSADQIFFYVNQSFAPSPDQLLSNLCSCFGSDGKLVLHYSVTPAWG